MKTVPGTKKIINTLLQALEKGYCVVSDGKVAHLPLHSSGDVQSLPWPSIWLNGGVLSVAINLDMQGLVLPLRVEIEPGTLRLYLSDMLVWQQDFSISETLWGLVRKFIAGEDGPLDKPKTIPGTDLITTLNIAQAGYSAEYAKADHALLLRVPSPRPIVGKGTLLWAEVDSIIIFQDHCKISLVRKVMGVDVMPDPTFQWGE